MATGAGHHNFWFKLCTGIWESRGSRFSFCVGGRSTCTPQPHGAPQTWVFRPAMLQKPRGCARDAAPVQKPVCVHGAEVHFGRVNPGHSPTYQVELKRRNPMGHRRGTRRRLREPGDGGTGKTDRCRCHNNGLAFAKKEIPNGARILGIDTPMINREKALTNRLTSHTYFDARAKATAERLLRQRTMQIASKKHTHMHTGTEVRGYM